MPGSYEEHKAEPIRAGLGHWTVWVQRLLLETLTIAGTRRNVSPMELGNATPISMKITKSMMILRCSRLRSVSKAEMVAVLNHTVGACRNPLILHTARNTAI